MKKYFATAALGYLAIFILAIFANFFVFEPVYVAGDVERTAANIASTPHYLWGGIAFLIVAAIDIVIAWALYHIFKTRSEPVALLATLMRVGQTIILAAATTFFILAAQHAHYLEIFHLMWMVALFFFGIHLLLIATLLYGETRVQTVIGALLAIAGLAYMLDTAALFVFENYTAIAETILVFVAVPGIIGELGFTTWLAARALERS